MTPAQAKQFAYRRLAIRSYHSCELQQVMIKKGFELEIVEQVINELVQLGYLNDAEWTESYVNRLSHRYGPRMIKQKLRMKGIEENSSISENSSEDQKENIKHLLETKYRTKSLNDPKERQKVIASLMRRGYDLDSVLSLFREIRD